MTCAHRAHQMERRLRIISIGRMISCLSGVISFLCITCVIIFLLWFCITSGTRKEQRLASEVVCSTCGMSSFFCITFCGAPMDPDHHIAGVGVWPLGLLACCRLCDGSPEEGPDVAFSVTMAQNEGSTSVGITSFTAELGRPTRRARIRHGLTIKAAKVPRMQ